MFIFKSPKNKLILIEIIEGMFQSLNALNFFFKLFRCKLINIIKTQQQQQQKTILIWNSGIYLYNKIKNCYFLI